MKRFVLFVILPFFFIVAIVWQKEALGATGASGVVVTVPTHIQIQQLGAITINNITFSTGDPVLGSGSGTDAFIVAANVATTITAVATQPTTGGWVGTLAASVSPESASKGKTNITLTATVTGVTMDVSPADYAGGSITVTVTGP